MKFVATVTSLLVATTVNAQGSSSLSCADRVNNNVDKLTECVTTAGVFQHLVALQQFADHNDGTRRAGTQGYKESAFYVGQLLEAAGYDVTYSDIHDVPYFFNNQDSILEQVSPQAISYPFEAKEGFRVMDFSGSGDVTAPTQKALNFGCWPEDYEGFQEGNIAVILRGACSFGQKSFFAETVGLASAVLIYNDGLGPDRLEAIDGTLDWPGAQVPVLGLSYELGLALSEPGVVVRAFVDMFVDFITDMSVIAETPGGDPNNVVMVGAHLDSQVPGPGIQDNGSGVAALLEVALQMKKVEPVNKVRFAFWGAEELGLFGSFQYLMSLTQEQGEAIALYLNFDMIASPNYVIRILDGTVGAPGGAGIQGLFQRFYTSRGSAYGSQPVLCFSDYCGFFFSGIPIGGVFTGAFELKTEEEAELFGGIAGEPHDTCYHLACDTIDNVNLEALDLNSDAIAYVTLSLAMSTEAVNGGKGKGNFKPEKLERDAVKAAGFDRLGDKLIQ